MNGKNQFKAREHTGVTQVSNLFGTVRNLSESMDINDISSSLATHLRGERQPTGILYVP